MFKELLIYAFSYFGLFTSIMLLLSFFENRKKTEGPKPYFPVVSVIVPAYNEEGTIAATIDSLLNLDYPKKKLDLLVINDGSTDRTLEIAKQYKKDGVRVFSKPNGGKASALNFGLKKAKGEIVGPLDADCEVMPDTLKKMTGYFRDKKVAAVAPSIKIWKCRGFMQKVQRIEFLVTTLIRKIFTLLGGLHLMPGPFGMFRKSFMEEHGGWDEKTITEDLEISLRIESKKEYLIENALEASVYTVPALTYKEAYMQRLRWFKGFIENVWNYRRMFLSREYGNMGLFVLPASVFSIVLMCAIFMYNMGKLSINVAKNLYDLYLIGFDITHWFEFNFDMFFLNTSGTFLIPVFLLGLATFMFYLARKHDDSPEGAKTAYVYFLASYWFFAAVIWISAAFHKATGRTVQWKARRWMK